MKKIEKNARDENSEINYIAKKYFQEICNIYCSHESYDNFIGIVNAQMI
jgi:hypothetical protein